MSTSLPHLSMHDPLRAAAPLPGGMQHPSLPELLWRRRWTLVAILGFALAGGVAYLLRATPLFTSDSRLYVERIGPRILKDSQGLVAQSDATMYLFTQAELLKSTPILAGALQQPDIARLKLLEGIDNPVAFLKQVLNVEVGTRDGIITVSGDSPRPEEAAKLVNAVVQAFVTYHAAQRKSTALEVLKILQKEKDKRDAELAEKMKAMLAFKRENSSLSLDYEKGGVVAQQLMRLAEALAQAQQQVLEAKAHYDAAGDALQDATIRSQLVESQRTKGVYTAASRELGELRAELGRTETQLAAVRRRFGAEHPVVRNAAAAIDAIQERIAEREARAAEEERHLVEVIIAVARQEWQSAVRKEEELARAIAEQQRAAVSLNTKAAEYAMLDSDFRRTERLCEILDSRIKELNITEDAGTLNISILEVARPADTPSKPQKARVMLQALALGLILGLAAALAREWMDPRLRSAAEIASLLRIPVLSVIPHMPGGTSIASRGQVVHREPMSAIAEAYRTVRTAIFFGLASGQARSVLVTSPAPGDGKTTSASNLALAMAQAGQRVLLLDADFRKPMQHRVFDVSNDVGLSKLLTGRASVKQATVHSGVANLDLIPCGPIPPNPSEILNSPAFGELLERLHGQYDHVVVDSPPVMPVTDARILSAICDVTLLILRAGQSTRRHGQHAREVLQSVGARILGCVVNDVSRSQGRYGYYGEYTYSRYGEPAAPAEKNGNGSSRKRARSGRRPAKV